MIRLWHGGPYGHSASVLIALREKGLTFEEQAVDRRSQNGTAPAQPAFWWVYTQLRRVYTHQKKAMAGLRPASHSRHLTLPVRNWLCEPLD